MRKSGCAHGLSLLVTCHTPTPPSSVTSTGPALVRQTLLSSPCLSQPHKSPLPLLGTYSFNCSGNSYSCSKTQLEKPLPAVKFHQYPRILSQAASIPPPQFSNTQSSPTQTLRLPSGARISLAWPGSSNWLLGP